MGKIGSGQQALRDNDDLLLGWDLAYSGLSIGAGDDNLNHVIGLFELLQRFSFLGI